MAALHDAFVQTATPTDTHLLRNYVGGAWREAETADALDVRDPATGELIARAPLSGAADVDAGGSGHNRVLYQSPAAGQGVNTDGNITLRFGQ